MVALELSGHELCQFIGPGPEHCRLWNLLQDVENDDGCFWVFDAGGRRYAVNPTHLTFCHLPFEVEEKADKEADDHAYEVRFYMTDRATPLTFGVAPDTSTLDDEEADGIACQLQDLFFYAESGGETRLKFTDEDGETAFFRAKDVAMFSVPPEAVEPKPLAAADDEHEEADGGGAASG